MTAAVGDPTFPEVTQNVVRPNAPVVGRVVSTELCTKAGKKAAGFVRHVAIDVSGTALAGAFRAGQSFGVVPSGEDAKGRPHKVRLYSIASPTAGEDGNGTTLATTVKRLLDEDWNDHRLRVGVASNFLCDLQVGDEVQVAGPNGKRFILPEDASSYNFVFFATGTGIAPFRGMIADLAALPEPPRSAVLVMGVPYETDLLYDEQFRELEAKHPWFRYVTAISRGTQIDTNRPLYVGDRVSADPDAGTDRGIPALLRSDRTLIYVCGIGGMELGILRALANELTPDELARYVTIADEGVASDPAAWTRRMISRDIRPTRRVMLEVY
ncbi:MAG: hypothetical protein CMJ31_04885 [Phycisphaerae bacterium]|nr:hypothetical protein [Phycisphaerae bacterium]